MVAPVVELECGRGDVPLWFTLADILKVASDVVLLVLQLHVQVQLLLGLMAVFDCVPIKSSLSPGVELAAVQPVTLTVTVELGTGADCVELAVVMPPVTVSLTFDFESCDCVELTVVMPPVAVKFEFKSCDCVELVVVVMPPVTVKFEFKSCDCECVELAVVMPPVTVTIAE